MTMKRFADQSELRRMAEITAEYALDDRERRGKPRPAIVTIIATDDEDVAVLCSETFAQFEHDALMNGDAHGVEEVRRAMTANPGNLVVYVMGLIGNEPCKMVFVAFERHQATEDQFEFMAHTVRTMESEGAMLPDTVIVTIQKNDSDTNFKPHLGESWRAQVSQFRSPEHLAEALAEPDPDLIEEVRAARREAPDEMVVVLWDSLGMLLVTRKKAT
jgi:hypothetical protein